MGSFLWYRLGLCKCTAGQGSLTAVTGQQHKCFPSALVESRFAHFFASLVGAPAGRAVAAAATRVLLTEAARVPPGTLLAEVQAYMQVPHPPPHGDATNVVLHRLRRHSDMRTSPCSC
jgi:hypothetical protein